MEYKDFEDMNEFSEYGSGDSCYVVYSAMVFNVTETLEEMDNLGRGDCGKDVTNKFNPEQGEAFHDLNVDNYVGVVLSEIPRLDEDPADRAQEGEEQRTENAETEEVVEANGAQGAWFDTSSVFFPGILALIAVLFIALFFARKKSNETQEYKKEETKK